MSALYVREIRTELEIPEFGVALREHISEKKNPAARASSISAWTLLYDVLEDVHSEICFDADGKPYLANGPHFSLSHSASLAAVLISNQPCGVDIEKIDNNVGVKLAERCLCANEQGRDFFECWTKKECLVKLDGRSLFAHPENIDTTEYDEYSFTTRICDAAGQVYALSAICADAAKLKVQYK